MESNVSWGDWVIIRYLRAPIMGWFITWYSAVFFKDVIKMGLNASIYFMNSEPITRKGEKHVRPIKGAQEKLLTLIKTFSLHVSLRMILKPVYAIPRRDETVTKSLQQIGLACTRYRHEMTWNWIKASEFPGSRVFRWQFTFNKCCNSQQGIFFNTTCLATLCR